MIPTNYQVLSGYKTVYSETELRQAIAIAEVTNLVGESPGSSTVITPTLISVSSSGTIPAGRKSVSIANIGTASGTVLGTTFPPGAAISYSVEGRREMLSEIAYNATGTTFLIGATE